MSTKVSLCRTEVCLLIWEPCGRVAARKALAETVTSTFGPSAGKSVEASRGTATSLGRTLFGRNMGFSGTLGCPTELSSERFGEQHEIFEVTKISGKDQILQCFGDQIPKCFAQDRAQQRLVVPDMIE